jgi:hypothetical protein
MDGYTTFEKPDWTVQNADKCTGLASSEPWSLGI